MESNGKKSTYNRIPTSATHNRFADIWRSFQRLKKLPGLLNDARAENNQRISVGFRVALLYRTIVLGIRVIGFPALCECSFTLRRFECHRPGSLGELTCFFHAIPQELSLCKVPERLMDK